MANTSLAMAAAASSVARIPAMFYGTAWKGEATTGLVLQALSSGFRGIDTAGQRKHYREDLVGAAVARAESDLSIPREKLWLQTKFTPVSGQDLNGPMPYDPDSRPRVAVRKSFETSLRNLHQGEQWLWGSTKSTAETSAKAAASEEGSSSTETPATTAKRRPYIDSYILHSPLSTLEETLEAWTEMEELALEGQVRLIGFSNVYDARILAALRAQAKRISPRILQNRWHFSSGHDISLLSMLSPVLSPNDFATDAPGASGRADADAANAITYQPFWTLTGNPRVLTSSAVISAASAHSWTPAQVLYRFVAQGFGLPGVQCTVLSGTTDEAHMREAVHAVLGDEALSEDEVDAIRKEVYGE